MPETLLSIDLLSAHFIVKHRLGVWAGPSTIRARSDDWQIGPEGFNADKQYTDDPREYSYADRVGKSASTSAWY